MRSDTACCDPNAVPCDCVAARCGRIIVIQNHTIIACDVVAANTATANGTELVNISKPWSNTTSVNETYVSHQRQMQPRKFSILDRMEAGLLQARAAIGQAKVENQTHDPDYVPEGPMYWNAKAFHSMMHGHGSAQAPVRSRGGRHGLTVLLSVILHHKEPLVHGCYHHRIGRVLLPCCCDPEVGTLHFSLILNYHLFTKNFYDRSYLEMEKQFKVFVYEEGEPPVFHNGPCKSIYSMEGNFIHAMEMNDQFRTRDPEKAHVFFLPFSVVMLVRFVYIRDSHDFGPIRKTVIDYVNLVAGRYPYWNRSLGADHFMLACHDWGPETSLSVPNMYKNSIRVLCNANTSEGFNPSKDVSFPEINLQTGTIIGFVGGPSASKRPVLAFFAGGLHGYIRSILLEHWENKDEDIQVHRYLPKEVSYYAMLRKSKFCLCPSGYEVASPRVVEAIYTGCVPVLISDHYVPPFSDVLNWKSFSVEVSVKDIPNLKEILTRISPRQYIRMQRRIGQIRRHFEVNSPPKRFDVFHMILHSIWLRRLNFRIIDDQ
ncbi:hypothetical protein Lal_00037800 [Lupinus albus]|nr:hypothetical protein Lal_00037800 [Lupinus albus]